MGNTDDAKWIKLSHKRIWWTKRLLRHMPRRGNLDKYPGLKWIHGFAKGRVYLWSFRYAQVAPALYVGTIISLLPIYGLQIPAAILFALLLRANLPIFVALQFLTNWLTTVPLAYACYEIGRWSLHIFDVTIDPLTVEQFHLFVHNLAEMRLAENGRMIGRVFLVTSLGAVILGSFLGTLFNMAYKLLTWRTRIILHKVRQIRERHREERQAQAKDAAPAEANKTAPESNQPPPVE
jgi:uncharacterized protein (DUF2062 family)